MWISLKMLCSPVLASFADSKLLDFAQTSDSMTLHINRTLCIACYNTVYVRLAINPQNMRFRHGFINPAAFLAQSMSELAPIIG